MKKPHILIERFQPTTENTIYQVYFVNRSVHHILYSSPFKQGAYQNAHREAKKNNVPLYETYYLNSIDRNGFVSLVPNKVVEIPLEKTTTN
jgi:hypothetical protein